jgi:hypothetical protein
MISMESILGVEDTIRNVDQEGLHKLILKFQRKQPAVFVYLAAVSKREELNDDEEDVFFTTALVLWIVIVENSQAVKKVLPKTLNAMDDQLMSTLENERALTFPSFSEPKVLEYAAMRLTEPQPGFEIREDVKPLLFAFMKVVIDALLEARV